MKKTHIKQAVNQPIPNTTKYVEELSVNDYKLLIRNCTVKLGAHALDHLSNSQRKVFKDDDLIRTVTKENPRKILLQKNGRYALFFRRSEYFREIILEINEQIATIISYMDEDTLPNVQL